MQHLSVLHENVVIGKILLAALTALGSCVLVTSFVLCGDVYGGGPAFVAFSNGVAVCSFVGWHWYIRRKGTVSQYYNISFGISVILTIAALQQSVMYGGLSETTFSVRMASIMNGLEDTANGTCISVKNCLSLDFTDMATYIKNLPQETGAEVTFCVLQALAFVVFIPFTIAQYIGSNSDSDTKTDSLDYSGYAEDAASGTSGEYADL